MRAWIALCLLLLLPRVASSGAPTPPQVTGTCSRVPSRIVLVGTDGARPDARLGAFEVGVCRWTLPVAGATVAVTTGATPGVRLGRDADPQPVSTNCSGGVLNFSADAGGICRITLPGFVDLAQLIPGTPPTVTLYANGVWFGDIPVVCYDLDGVGGVGANDFSLWLMLFGSGEDHRVADYNGSGTLDADDLSHWMEVFGSGAESVSAAPLCP